MQKLYVKTRSRILLLLLSFISINANAQIIISQYYEGTGTNKWIELTNLGTTAVNTASPQLKLGLWSKSGTTGNIAYSGSADQILNLTVTIPAKGTVLIGNTANGTEITYLTAASAVQTSNTVINFNGNDGIALLNASNTIIDRFVQGINATDISYARKTTVTAASASYVSSQWTSATIAAVNSALSGNNIRLGYHLSTACTTPAAQPTALGFTSVTPTSINGSFTGTAAADEYLIVRSTSNSLSANPADGVVYNTGDFLGGGVVVNKGTATSFTSSSLNSGTTYYFFIYSLKSTSCTGGTKYLIANPLTGNQTTLLPACISPGAQPTLLSFNGVSTNSISGSFNAAVADEYLIVQSSNATLSATPADGTVYNAGNSLGGGIVIGRSNNTSFNAANLNAGTTYYFTIFSVNSNCSGGPKYLAASPLSGSQATGSNVCITPTAQPAGLVFGTTTATSIAGSFTGSGADEYLVVQSTSATLSDSPLDGTVYTAGNNLGGGTVVSRSASIAFSAPGLTASTPYYFFVYSISSSCSGGPVYLTTAPLYGSQTTSAVSSGILNTYFGNLHSHSSYSDGNADDITKIPGDDYAFAKNSMCMDFLGISEHNHTGAGMQLADWQPGRTQAAAATTANFVGLYGMEWGVISSGGHVIVYGIDSLMGWEPGQYQLYVPKSVYTGVGGLFDMLNKHGGNALAYLAHPNSTDYNNVLGSTFDMSADNAIVGSTVESGPAFSTNTTYSNPATSMSYLSYYRNMLSKGYHLGPTIDHDNHNMTFGRTTKTRLAILAPSLSENDLLDGMRQMRFYASQDCNARINYSINTQPIGSILTEAGAPVISVSCVTTAAVSSIKIMAGVPGSGIAATEIGSGTGNSLTFTDNSLANLSQKYYYLDITETDGSRIITAPVWYTRNDQALWAPSSITSFFTVNEKDRVILKWTTLHEAFNESFTIERSIDFGRTYKTIGSLRGKGFNNKFSNSYAMEDFQPFAGTAYYRLISSNASGEMHFSDVKIIDRGTRGQTYFTVYPNPVQGLLSIKLVAAAEEKTMIELFDMAGRRVAVQPVFIKNGEQQILFNMSKITTGTYLLKIKSGTKMLTQLLNKL